MATNVQKITLSSSRDIPFNKLVLSQHNVRRIKAGVSIEELAEDIARRTLLQSITVRAVVDETGVETGMFEIPAGGRRFRALELLVKQKRLVKTAPIPCVIREGGIAEEDSLAENVQRAPLHPLDQFRAFLTLRERGQSEEEIAAAFFVSVAVVRQRLRLASVSPKLLDIYAEDGMTLDQLMAFTVSGDHERQEQVFERLANAYDKQPYAIRRMLTEGAVRAVDKRARFIGIDAYEEAGGTVLHDLFQGDDGGWLQDAGLLDLLVAERLRDEAEVVRAEGWKWIEVAPDFAYGHVFGLRQLRGDTVLLTDKEEATLATLQQEADDIEAASAEAGELTDEQDVRMGEIESAIAVINERPSVYDPTEVARAGAFVSIDSAGGLRIERGYIRCEDELPINVEPVDDVGICTEPSGVGGYATAARLDGDGSTIVADAGGAIEPEEDEGLKPIPDRLMSELTAHRTVALREAVGADPQVAFMAALHALVLRLFYRYALDTCLDLELKSIGFASQAPGLADSWSAKSLDLRHSQWEARLPKEGADLWDALAGLDAEERSLLFAHCVGASVNATFDAYNRRPRALAHADILAQAVDLDMVAAGWIPTIETYFGRVTKARIVGAVRESRGDAAAERIVHLKKGEMAEKAQALLAGSGWLPEPLRTPGRTLPTIVGVTYPEVDLTVAADVSDQDYTNVEETAADGGESVMADDDIPAEDDAVAFHHAIAAE